MLLLAILVSGCATQQQISSSSTDWHQWLGPIRDGTTPDSDWNPEALRDLKIFWQAAVGSGRSAPVIAGRDLYIVGKVGREQAVRHLRSDTGKEVWKYVIPQKAGPSGALFNTGAIDADHFYAASAEGVVFCLDRKRGGLVWQQDLADLGAEKYFKLTGWELSPLIADGLVILSAGEYGIALNKDSGELVWGRPGSLARSSGALASVGGRNYFVVATSEQVHLIDLQTGEPVQSRPWRTQIYQQVQWNPIVVDQTIFISRLYTANMFSLSANGLEELWESQNAASYNSSWVHVDGYLYGNYDHVPPGTAFGQVRCLEAASGEIIWQEDSEVKGMLIAAGDKLIRLSEKGTLTIAAADPSGYREFSDAKLPDNLYTTPPALVGNRLYVRSLGGELYCIDMR